MGTNSAFFPDKPSHASDLGNVELLECSEEMVTATVRMRVKLAKLEALRVWIHDIEPIVQSFPGIWPYIISGSL